MASTSRTPTPPSTPASDRIQFDIIEYIADKIIYESEGRMENWRTLEYFYSKLDDPTRTSGGLRARYQAAEIVTAVAFGNAYDDAETVCASEALPKSLLNPPLPLVTWDAGRWSDLSRLLERTRDLFVREDVVLPLGGDDDENAVGGSSSRPGGELYSSKLNGVLNGIRVQRTLSPFRYVLERQLLEEKESRVDIDPRVVADFGKNVERDHRDGTQSLNALEGLLVRSDGTRSEVSLASPGELSSRLQEKPFDLRHLSDKICSLVQRWIDDVFDGNDATPILTKLGYDPMIPAAVTTATTAEGKEEDSKLEQQHQRAKSQKPLIAEDKEEKDSGGSSDQENEHPSPPKQPTMQRRSFSKRKRGSESDTDSDLEALRTARRHLKGDDNKDPMREIQAIASAVPPRKRKKGTLYDKKKSAQQIRFADSDEEDEDEDEGVQLSELPVHEPIPKICSPQPAPTQHREPGKRMRFTEEEKTAIKEGVKKFGVGKWSQIKSHYAQILVHRTAVNVKDCYRTMDRKGEL